MLALTVFTESGVMWMDGCMLSSVSSLKERVRRKENKQHIALNSEGVGHMHVGVVVCSVGKGFEMRIMMR